MGDPVDPSANLSKDAPAELRGFLGCSGLSVTFKDGKIPWLSPSNLAPDDLKPFLPNVAPTVTITPGADGSSATISTSVGGIPLPSVGASVSNGQLAVDTSSLPDVVAKPLQEQIDNLNAWFKAHDKSFGAPTFGKGQVTLTKVALPVSATPGPPAPPIRMSVVGGPTPPRAPEPPPDPTVWVQLNLPPSGTQSPPPMPQVPPAPPQQGLSVEGPSPVPPSSGSSDVTASGPEGSIFNVEPGPNELPPFNPLDPSTWPDDGPAQGGAPVDPPATDLDPAEGPPPAESVVPQLTPPDLGPGPEVPADLGFTTPPDTGGITLTVPGAEAEIELEVPFTPPPDAAPSAESGEWPEPLPEPPARMTVAGGAANASDVFAQPAPQLTRKELLEAVGLIRALIWPGSSESVTEAEWRVFLLNLLLHVYMPTQDEAEQKWRVDVLTLLEVIDWGMSPPSEDEFHNAIRLERVWVDRPASGDERAWPALNDFIDRGIVESQDADRQRTYQELGDEHDAWVRKVFGDGGDPAEVELIRRSRAERLGSPASDDEPVGPYVLTPSDPGLLPPPEPPPPKFFGVLEDDAAPASDDEPVGPYVLTPSDPGLLPPPEPPPPKFFGVLEDDAAPASDDEPVGPYVLTPSDPGLLPPPEPPPPKFFGVLEDDDRQPTAGPDDGSPPPRNEVLDSTLPAESPTQRSPGPSRTLIGAAAAVIVLLIAAIAVFGGGLGSSNLTGSTASGTPPGGSQPSVEPATTPKSSSDGSAGLTRNGGAPLTGAAALTNPQGGCSGYAPGQTSPTNLVVSSGTLHLAIFRFGSLSMTGTIAADGSFSVANPDGSVKAQGKLGPTSLSGTLTANQNGCTETLQFLVAFGSGGGGGTTVTPRPALTPPPPPFVIIAFNEISFVQAALDYCHKEIVVNYDFTINGIPPNTDVVIQVAGRGIGSKTETFKASPGVKFGTAFDLPGGPGTWSDQILTIGGQAPPSSGSKVGTSISC